MNVSAIPHTDMTGIDLRSEERGRSPLILPGAPLVRPHPSKNIARADRSPSRAASRRTPCYSHLETRFGFIPVRDFLRFIPAQVDRARDDRPQFLR